MRILFISDPGTVGGATRSLVDVVTEMTNRKYEVIVCTSQKTSLNAELDSLKIKNFNCGHRSAMNPKSPYKWKRPLKYPYEMLAYYLSLPKAIKIIENSVDLKTIDIIHTNSARNDIGCLLSEKYNIPHVMHIREFGQEDFDCCIYRNNYYQFLNNNVSRFIAISGAVKKSWVSKGLNAEKVKVIYNGINYKAMSKHDYAKHDYVKLVMVGGICSAKGQLYAVKALRELPEDVKKRIKLDIIGWSDPQYLKLINEYLDENSMNEIVKILPASNNIHDLLSDYDVGLMCSKSEGFGRVTAEYMFAGLPVVASDTGANKEIVQDGITGLIYKYGDSKDLANKILKLIENDNLIQKYGLAGNIVARKNFTIANNVDQILNVYSELLK